MTEHIQTLHSLLGSIQLISRWHYKVLLLLIAGNKKGLNSAQRFTKNYRMRQGHLAPESSFRALLTAEKVTSSENPLKWPALDFFSSDSSLFFFPPLCQKPCWTMTNEDWSIIILASQLPGVNKSWQGCCAEKQRQGKKETDNKRQEKRGWSKMETRIDPLWMPLSDGGLSWLDSCMM